MKSLRFKYLFFALLLRSVLFSQDTAEVNRMNRMSAPVGRSWPDSALNLGQRALAIASQINYSLGLADAHNNVGMAYYYMNQNHEALKSVQKALDLAKQLGDKSLIADTYVNLYMIQRISADYASSVNSSYEALKIFEETKNKKGIRGCYNNIGNVYNDQQNYEKALEFFLKSALYLGEEDVVDKASLYNNLGLVYTSLKKFDDAMKYFTESLTLRERMKNRIKVADVQTNIGVCLSSQAKYKEGLEYLFKAAEVYESAKNELFLEIVYTNIGDCYSHMKKFGPASEYLQKGLKLAQALDDKEGIKVSYNSLSEFYAQTGDFKKAFEYSRKFIVFKDSLISLQSQSEIAEIQTRYETDKREKEIEWLNREKSLKDEIIEKQNAQRRLYIAGLILLAGFLAYVFMSLRRKHRDNLIIRRQKTEVEEQKKLVEDKNKEILDSIHYAQRIQKAFITSQKYFEKNIGRLTGKKQE